MAAIIGMIIVLAMANEGANGVNFSLVPHCNPCEYNLHYNLIFRPQLFIRFKWFHGEIFIICLVFDINVPSTERHCRSHG